MAAGASVTRVAPLRAQHDWLALTTTSVEARRAATRQLVKLVEQLPCWWGRVSAHYVASLALPPHSYLLRRSALFDVVLSFVGADGSINNTFVSVVPHLGYCIGPALVDSVYYTTIAEMFDNVGALKTPVVRARWLTACAARHMATDVNKAATRSNVVVDDDNDDNDDSAIASTNDNLAAVLDAVADDDDDDECATPTALTRSHGDALADIYAQRIVVVVIAWQSTEDWEALRTDIGDVLQLLVPVKRKLHDDITWWLARHIDGSAIGLVLASSVAPQQQCSIAFAQRAMLADRGRGCIEPGSIVAVLDPSALLVSATHGTLFATRAADVSYDVIVPTGTLVEALRADATIGLQSGALYVVVRAAVTGHWAVRPLDHSESALVGRLVSKQNAEKFAARDDALVYVATHNVWIDCCCKFILFFVCTMIDVR